MKKNGKRRGRPIVIKPWMDALIANRVIAEKQKPPQERTQRNILASEIQEEIRSRIQGTDTAERQPELSTLEKRITFMSKKDSPEDKPWTIFTLNQHPISPEALPKVLELYRRFKLIAEQLGEEEAAFMPYFFSIRYVKWLVRLSALKSLEDTIIFSIILAETEQLSELIGYLPNYGLLEEALAASEANDFERGATVMERYMDQFTSGLGKLLGPQCQDFIEKLREFEEKRLKKLKEEEEQ